MSQQLTYNHACLHSVMKKICPYAKTNIVSLGKLFKRHILTAKTSVWLSIHFFFRRDVNWLWSSGNSFFMITNCRFTHFLTQKNLVWAQIHTHTFKDRCILIMILLKLLSWSQFVILDFYGPGKMSVLAYMYIFLWNRC